MSKKRRVARKGSRLIFKKIFVCSLVAFAAVFGGFMGVDQFHVEQRTMEVQSSRAVLEGPGNVGKQLDIKVKSAVLIDASSGKVLYARNGNEELPPASVTKVMTMLLVMEAVDSGRITLGDEVTISEKAASMGGSQMYMEVGETHTVEQLLEGVAMVSANDGCVALAEYVGGSEGIFVEEMNARAKELGMNHTSFVNTNGLPVAKHYTSAYDIALMSKELLKHDDVKKWFTKWQDTIKVGLPEKQTKFGLANTNRLIKMYNGANGIKTGFTQDAGYCLSGSAARNGMELIAVVMGSKTSEERFAAATTLLDYGFSGFENVPVANAGKIMKTVTVDKGSKSTIGAVTEEDLSYMVKKGEGKSVNVKVKCPDSVDAPVKEGMKLGELLVYENGEEKGAYDLVADSSAEKASVFQLYIRMIKKLI